MLFGVIEIQKKEKTLNLSDTQDLNLEEIYKLKEYDNIRKIINSMKNKNFPYISYLEGGFKELHDESLDYKIELVGHSKKKCLLCIKNKNKKDNKINKILSKLIIKKEKNEEKEDKDNISDSLWKSPTTINSNQIGVLLNNKKNILLYCCLSKFKNKLYHNKNFKVYVFILFDKKSIDIYKSEMPKEKYIYNSNDLENNTNPNYYNLGITDDNNTKNLELKLFQSVRLKDIKKVSFNRQQKSIIIIEIKNKEKNNENRENNYLIELEFFTVDDSKYFMKSIKNAYENNI